MYTKKIETKVENELLATHISDNPNFEGACLSGDGAQIMSIIEAEMKKNNLFTKGSKKLQADIIRMLGGKERVSTSVGQRILFFVYNSRLKGIGLGVN